jgi:hypothetical protein
MLSETHTLLENLDLKFFGQPDMVIPLNRRQSSITPYILFLEKLTVAQQIISRLL